MLRPFLFYRIVRPREFTVRGSPRLSTMGIIPCGENGLHGAQAMDTIEKVNLSWQIPSSRPSASHLEPPLVLVNDQGACIARLIENRLTRPIKKCWLDQALRSSVNIVTSKRAVVSNNNQKFWERASCFRFLRFDRTEG
jgi:hypothetical protein